MTWEPGDHVVLRDVWQGHVIDGRPVTVAHDSDTVVALHLAPGTVWVAPPSYERPNDGWNEAAAGRFASREERTWHTNTVLILMRPGEPYSPQAFWNEEGRFIGWYVNLQDPMRRTALGFDTMDHLLDIVVAPDCSSWRWKDEEHIESVVEIGLITREAADLVRRNGERVIEIIERGEAWWTEWSAWEPAADWPIPSLPEGWDRID